MECATWRQGISAAAVLLFCSAPSAAAQDWAKAMFDATSHDFGTVARGAKVEHHFTIENKYEEDMQITKVVSTCGCTTAQINKRLLKTWDKADLVATIDTRNHKGRKDSAIEVEFGAPFEAKIQIQIHVVIRGDVVVQPGEIQFGSVNQGSELTRNAAISYAGRGDWKIEKVECSNPHIEARVVETSRAPGPPGLVNYNLSVTLKASAPPGYIQDQLVLVTNDSIPRAARVPVSVEGKVESSLSVHPSSLLMGTAKAGQAITRNIVLQGKTPFRIVSAQPNDERFQCTISNELKAVHVVPVTFLSKDANAVAGIVNAKIRIETDMAGAAAVEVAVSVQVAATPPK